MSGYQHGHYNDLRGQIGNTGYPQKCRYPYAQRSAPLWLLPLLLAIRLCLGCPAFGQGQSLLQMLHTSWTGRDGAPQDVTALAQTPDGTLWIGSTGGLFSFDGITFTPFQPGRGEPSLISNAIASLLVTKNGDLWVGGGRVAGVARIANRHITIYSRLDGHNLESLTFLQQDARGTIWAIADDLHIVWLGADHVWHLAANQTATGGYIRAFSIDSADTQWVLEDRQIYRRASNEVRFRPSGSIDSKHDLYSKHIHFTEDRDHNLWIMGEHFDPHGRKLTSSISSLPLNDVLSTSDGYLWLAVMHRGLIRLALPPSAGPHSPHTPALLDRYAVTDGLSSNNEAALLNGSDGSVWVGGLRGLDRFVRAHLVPAIRGSEGGGWSTCTNPQGQVWIANDGGMLSVIKDGQPRAIYKADGIKNLYCGRKGDVWFMDSHGIVDVLNGRIRRLPSLPGHLSYNSYWNFIAMLELSDQELLASEAGRTSSGIWKFKSGRWEELIPTVDSQYVTAMMRQDSGRLFLGRIDGKISTFENNSLHTISTTPTWIGAITTFARTSRDVFALGANGIAVLHGDSFQMLLFDQPELARTVSGLIESRDGDIWINGSRGIVRIPSKEMLAALNDPSYKIVGQEIHEGDFVGPAAFWKPTPSAIMDIHGRLWFATLNGVVSFDPESAEPPSRLPQLSIRSVSADGRQLEASRTFPSKLQTLEIQYFGINLTNPEKVTYRYRLEGLDDTWQDVGRRTQAIYTRLRPSVYTFQVMASNGDNKWTTPVSSVQFTVLPYFYQEWWFVALCVLFSVFMVWLAFKIRLTLAYRTITMRAEDRADERVQIARELHDTLLQGVQGLLLTFHVAAQKASADDASKKLMERALTTADRLIIEGRNRVTSLRSEHLADGELLIALQGVASDLSSDTTIQCSITRTGNESTLDLHVVDEIFYIAREALTNAFRHSGARQIILELDYKKRSFSMICQDDGRGFDAQAAKTISADGHWGLRGMLERAERISGKISWSSSSGQGTTVQITIPSYRAYRRKPGFLGFSRSDFG